MRQIDRWAGVPLCALATVALKFYWSLRRKAPRPIRRILFIELSEMGSTILADPAIRKACDTTLAEPYFVIFAQNAGSLGFTGTIAPSNIFAIRTDSIFRLLMDAFAFLIWVRRNQIDTVIDLELFSRFTGLLSGLSGADRRIGFHRFHNEGLYRGEMLTHRVWYNPHIHIAKNFIALIDALLSESEIVSFSKRTIRDEELALPNRPVHAAVHENVKTKLEVLASCRDLSAFRLVLINPNASEMLPQRRWMPNRFAELIRRVLAARDDVMVMVTGAEGDRAIAEGIAAGCASTRCVSLAGHLSLDELPALYSLADLMVTNDSGPAHFAAALDLPTIVLFGPETPSLYRPLRNSRTIYAGLACSPCVNASNHRKSSCIDNACMRAISVDEVFAATMASVTARALQPA